MRVMRSLDWFRIGNRADTVSECGSSGGLILAIKGREGTEESQVSSFQLLLFFFLSFQLPMLSIGIPPKILTQSGGIKQLV